MAIPQLLNDIVQLLLQLAPAAAIVALVLAGIGLRREGGTNFVIGGSFTKWMLWADFRDPLTSAGLVYIVRRGNSCTKWRNRHILAEFPSV